MDVAYVFKENIDNNSQELLYSLRTLTNLPHGNVFISGDAPAWLTNCRHLNLQQEAFSDNYEVKHFNIGRNLIALCESPELSDDFILMNDDFFIMESCNVIPIRHWGTMDKVISHYDGRYPEGNRYVDAMKRTKQELERRGLTELKSYELHVPFNVNKQKFLNLMDIFEDIFWGEHTCLSQWRTVYGNYYGIGGDFMNDVKFFINTKNHNADQALEGSQFLSGTGGAFKGDFGDFIRAKFPDQSQYEAQTRDS